MLSSRTLAHPDTIVDSVCLLPRPTPQICSGSLQRSSTWMSQQTTPRALQPQRHSRAHHLWSAPAVASAPAHRPSCALLRRCQHWVRLPLAHAAAPPSVARERRDVPRGPGGLLFAEGCGTVAAASHAEALEPWEQETTECRSQHSSICPAGSFPFRRDGTLASPDAGMVALPSSSRADRVSSPSFLSTLEQRTHEQLRSKRSPRHQARAPARREVPS